MIFSVKSNNNNYVLGIVNIGELWKFDSRQGNHNQSLHHQGMDQQTGTCLTCLRIPDGASRTTHTDLDSVASFSCG